MQNLVGQTNDYDPYGHHKYQPPPPPEDDFMNTHPSLYPASRQFYQLEPHPQPRQQQVIDRPNTIELNNSYSASAMPPPAPAFQYNPSQVRLLVSRSLMVKIFYNPYVHTWDRYCRNLLKNVPLKKRVIVRTNLFELILKITLFFSGTFLENPATSIPGMDVAH